MTVWDAVTEFGRGLGLASLALENGTATLDLDSGQSIGLVLCDDQLILHLLTSAPHPEPALLLRALQACEARDLPAFPLQVGSRGQGADFSLIAATRMPADDVLPETLTRACERLLDWSQRVASHG